MAELIFPPTMFCNLYLFDYPNCWIQKLNFTELALLNIQNGGIAFPASDALYLKPLRLSYLLDKKLKFYGIRHP
jgi:hypothetical protein